MHRYTVELRVAGKNLELEQVTRTLGVTPTQVRRKGERKSERSTWTEDMWSFEVLPPGRDGWASLEDGLIALLRIFGPIQDRLHPYSSANNVFIWCGHFTSSFDGGPLFSPGLLKSLGDFGVELILDTYCEFPR